MIAFSGIDCSGKSTQIEITTKSLAEQGVRFRVIWSRGGYTSWLETLKTLIRRDKKLSKEEKSVYQQQIMRNSKKSKLLLWASILDLIRYYGIVFRLVELGGTMIVCDRYFWDTYIDFKIKYPKIAFENWISWKLLVKFKKQPQYSIIFTIPVEESIRRSALKNDPHPEDYEMRKQRIEYYREEIEKGRWEKVIDAEKSIWEVADEVSSYLGQANKDENSCH